MHRPLAWRKWVCIQPDIGRHRSRVIEQGGLRPKAKASAIDHQHEARPVEIASASGHRWMPARNTFIGPGKSVIDRHREVLTRLRFAATRSGEGSAFHRVMRPQGLCLPIISMAARLTVDAGTITAASISMGPVGPVPWFAVPAAEALIGGPANAEQFDKAVAIALASVSLRTSKYRATEEYRSAMIRTYLPLILARAAERAGAQP